MKLKRIDLADAANMVSACRTNGIETIELLKWVALHRQLKAAREEIAAFMQDLEKSLNLKETDDVSLTPAGRKYLQEEVEFETEKFLSQKQLISIKEQNSLNTTAFATLLDLLLIP